MNKPKNVFLIEDDEHDQYFFSYILRDIANAALQGIAQNGKDALAKLEKMVKLPDIIFTDIHMPMMDGLQCIAALQQSPILCGIPIVVLSTDITRVDQMRSLGAKAFIKKTSNIDHLKNQINRLVHLDFDRDNDIASQTFNIL